MVMMMMMMMVMVMMMMMGGEIARFKARISEEQECVCLCVYMRRLPFERGVPS